MFPTVETWSKLSSAQQSAILKRPALLFDKGITERIEKIIETVRRKGDAALFDFARELESADLNTLKVSAEEFASAENSLSQESRSAVDTAISNVRRFHEHQVPTELDITVNPGVRCERRNRPIDAVGLYVPAGSAPLPSAAIMLAVPAAIAGCPTRILCTPADSNGEASAATLFAAQQSGITEVFKVGGAQAIAAMAYGTESVPRVDKIFGPGGLWVTTAKRIVGNDAAGVAVDMPAGPSEVLVIADEKAEPRYVAADLLSQAEHGEDSQVILVTTNRSLVQLAAGEIESQLATLKRKEIAKAALRYSRAIIADDVCAAIKISNRYAPEHLIVQTEKPRSVLSKVRNAGSVFLGPWSPESVGDYCSGTNHVLPTCGMARSYSGLGVEQFMRQITVQELTKDGLRSLAPTVLELSSLEGLDAHGQAVRLRLEDTAATVPVQ